MTATAARCSQRGMAAAANAPPETAAPITSSRLSVVCPDTGPWARRERVIRSGASPRSRTKSRTLTPVATKKKITAVCVSRKTMVVKNPNAGCPAPSTEMPVNPCATAAVSRVPVTAIRA